MTKDQLNKLNDREYNSLKSLEKILNMEIPQFTKEKPKIGYKLNNIETNVAELNLINASIDFIPQELQDLKKLKVLSLKGNDIRKIENLPSSLRILILSNNLIKELPKSLDLPNMEILDLKENILEKLSGLAKFPKLKSMDIRSNQLRNFVGFQPLFKNFTHNRIKISGNPINSLKGFPKKLGNLTKLELSHLNLINLQGMPQRCPHIRELDLSFNNLQTLTGFPLNLPVLKHLNLQNNSLKDLSHIGMLPQLGVLDIRNNNIEKLDDTKKIINKSMTVLASGNPLNSLFGLNLNSLANLTDISNLNLAPCAMELLNLYKKQGNKRSRDELLELYQYTTEELRIMNNNGSKLTENQRERISHESSAVCGWRENQICDEDLFAY